MPDSYRADYSTESIKQLLMVAPEDKRIEVVENLSGQYISGLFSNEQCELIEEIFRLLTKDVATDVRSALSYRVKNDKKLPHDIALALAKDVEEVALPILEFSEVLRDSDLIEIIKTTKEITKCLAISSRRTVNQQVSKALVETNNNKIVDRLLHNSGAIINDEEYHKIIESFPENTDILSGIMSRKELPSIISTAILQKLPPNAVDKLIEKVSGSIREQLKSKYNTLSQAKKMHHHIDHVVDKGVKAASLKVSGLRSKDAELARLVDILDKTGESAFDLYTKDPEYQKMIVNLESSGKLTPFSTLCLGQLQLFEICISRLAQIPVANVRKLVRDRVGQGFRAIYQKAGLPESMENATFAVINVILDLEEESLNQGTLSSNRFLERVLNLAEQDVNNISYFVTMIKHHIQVASVE